MIQERSGSVKRFCFLVFSLWFTCCLVGWFIGSTAEANNTPAPVAKNVSKEIRFAPEHISLIISAEAQQLFAQVIYKLESLSQIQNPLDQFDVWVELQKIARKDEVFNPREFMEYPVQSGQVKSSRRVLFDVLIEFQKRARNAMIDRQSETYFKELDMKLMEYPETEYRKAFQDAWPYIGGSAGLKILTKLAEFFYEAATIEKPYIEEYLFLAEEAAEYGLLISNDENLKQLLETQIRKTLRETVSGIFKQRPSIQQREFSNLDSVFKEILVSESILSYSDEVAVSFFKLAFDLGYEALARDSLKVAILNADSIKSKKALNFSGLITPEAFSVAFVEDIAQFYLDSIETLNDGRSYDLQSVLVKVGKKVPDFIIPRLANIHESITARVLVSIMTMHSEKVKQEITRLLDSNDTAMRTQAMVILSIAGIRLSEFAPQILRIIQDSSLKNSEDRMQAVRTIGKVSYEMEVYLPCLVKILQEETGYYLFKSEIARAILDHSTSSKEKLKLLTPISEVIASYENWYSGSKEEDKYLNDLMSIVKKFYFVFEKDNVAPNLLKILEYIQVNSVESVCQYSITSALIALNAMDVVPEIIKIYYKSPKNKHILLSNLAEFPLLTSIRRLYVEALNDSDSKTLKAAIYFCGTKKINEALPALNRLLSSKDVYVRDEVRTSILRIEENIRLQKGTISPLPQ